MKQKMKKVSYLLLLVVLSTITFQSFGQTVNINDCTDDVLVEVASKFTPRIGKKIPIYSKFTAKRKVKIVSVTLTPTVCSEGTVTHKKKNRVSKDDKFYSMTIQIKENGKKKFYTVGYQLFLSMLKTEPNRNAFIEKLQTDQYQLAIDYGNNSLYLVSF